MSCATDLRTLAAINCKQSSGFVVDIDGSGAYFFVRETHSFTFVRFETGERTDLTLENFKTVGDNFSFTSFVLVEKPKSDSASSTAFIGLQYDFITRKYFCILFVTKMQSKSVEIVDEMDTSLIHQNTDSFSIHSEKSGNAFIISYGTETCTLSISQIRMNELKKLAIIPLAQREQLPKLPATWAFPFSYNDAVFYFIDEKKGKKFDKLMKLPFKGTDFRTSPLSTINHEFPPFPLSRKFTYFKDSFYFCSQSLVDSFTTKIWSLNMQQFKWSCRAIINHHSRTTFLDLSILPDGSAFLLTDCEECKASHAYQFDFSIESRYSLSEKTLGKGAFGFVKEGKVNQRKVAIKILHDFSAIDAEQSSTENRKKQERILLSAVSEARRLKTLSHESIVKGFGFEIEENRFMLFMELMTESVRQKIRRTVTKRLEEKDAFLILQQALEGLVYLHTYKPTPIVHRDIKCENILLDQNGKAKLGDLGLVTAVCLNSAGTTDLAMAPVHVAGTAFWQAPEVLAKGAPYGRKADVWSIGCSLVEMLTGNAPYHTHTHTQWVLGVNNGTLTYSVQELIPDASADVANILDKCFIRQVRNSAVGYFQQLAWKQKIRPHSWELIGDVISVNELRPAQENVKRAEKMLENVKTKITRFLKIAPNDED